MRNSRLYTLIIILMLIAALLPACTGQPATPEPTMPPPESGIETPPTSEHVTGELEYTADLTGSGTASASTEGIADPPSAVFDDDDLTSWQVPDSDSEWLGYDFGKGNSCIIGKYSITTHSNPVSMPRSFTLQGSGDGVSWTALDTRIGVLPAWSVSYTFDNTCTYRYYRLANIHPQPNLASFIIQDMELCSLVSTPEVSCPPSISCAKPSPPPDEDLIWSEAAGKDIRIEDGTWIWRGFHHEFKNKSHRFHGLQSEFYDIKYNFHPATGKSTLAGKVFGNQPISDWSSDKLEYYTIKRGIKTGVAEFRHGTMDEVMVSGDVDEHVEMVFPQHIDLDGLEKYDSVTIFMRGFSFEEYGSQTKSGEGLYPIQCFGLKISDVQRYENYLRVNLTVMLHLSKSPYTLSPKPDPWQYRVKYHYTLVGGNDGEFSYTLGDKYYSGEHVYTGSGDCPRAPEKVRETTITGAACHEQGVVVFRGFFVKINHEDPGAYVNLGRQVRTVDVAIGWQGYSHKTGTAIFYPDLYICNKGGTQPTMNTEYEGFFTLLQFRDPDQWEDTMEIIDAEGITSTFYRANLKPFSFQTP